MTVDWGPLVDHHCHGLVGEDLDRLAFEALMNEAAHASPLGTTLFDSVLGLAIRRHCAPVLDLEPLVAPDDYLRRRAELGAGEVNRRFLAAAGIATYLVDTGLGYVGPGAGAICSPDELAAIAGGIAREVVRLEQVAEQVLRGGATDFAGAVTERLRSAKAAGAVGAKSIAAYRVGLGLPADKPGAAELDRALAGASPLRLASMPVSAWLAHTALEAGLPLQLHVGYGDSDLDLLDCDPLRLTAFLRATQERAVPVLLLHNYPYHRNAAYLAQVFDHVFLDLGLGTHNTGALSAALYRETLELAPFGKLLFSTDAYGLAELYLLGTLLFQSGLGSVLDELVEAGDMTYADATYVGRLVGGDNARRVYGLGQVG